MFRGRRRRRNLSPPLLDAEVNDHHVACRSYGAIADVDCLVGDRPSHAICFVVDEAEVCFWGICAVMPANVQAPEKESAT